MSETLKPSGPRMQVVGIRLSREERRAIRRTARASKPRVTMSDFIREAALARVAAHQSQQNAA